MEQYLFLFYTQVYLYSIVFFKICANLGMARNIVHVIGICMLACACEMGGEEGGGKGGGREGANA